jgi:hypothetical protein
MAGVSNREFARLDGCDGKRVRLGVARGELAALPGGGLDPAQARTTWRKRAQRAASNGTATPAPGKLADMEGLREISLARLRRQELETRSALYADVETMRFCMQGELHELENRFRGMAGILAPQVAGRSLREIGQVTHQVVYDALTPASDRADPARPAPAAATKPRIEITDTMSKLEAERRKVIDQTALHPLDHDVRAGLQIGDRLKPGGRTKPASHPDPGQPAFPALPRSTVISLNRCHPRFETVSCQRVAGPPAPWLSILHCFNLSWSQGNAHGGDRKVSSLILAVSVSPCTGG